MLGVRGWGVCVGGKTVGMVSIVHVCVCVCMCVCMSNTPHYHGAHHSSPAPTHLPLSLVSQVHLVANEHKGEVLRVFKTGLNEKLIPPPVQVLEGLEVGQVKD